MLMPLSRSTRWACTVVSRSSQIFHRKARCRLQPGAELARVLGLPALLAAHVQRISDQYQGDVLLGGQLRQARQIFADVGALQRFQALGRKAELVAQRQPDAPFAQIEGQNSAGIH